MDDTTWETDSDFDKDEIINFIAFIIQGLFLLAIVIFIIYLIYKKIKGKNKRQKRINELDEEDNRIDDNKNNELL
jgi:predicted membrane protein